MSKSLPDFSSDSFTRYASARNGENLEVSLSSGYAVKYDLVGAIRRQYPDDEEFYANIEKFKNIIKAMFPGYVSINTPYKVHDEEVDRDPPLWKLSDELTLEDLEKILRLT